jgi:hypothetical protein
MQIDFVQAHLHWKDALWREAGRDRSMIGVDARTFQLQIFEA